jgi:hypothetical protein
MKRQNALSFVLLLIEAVFTLFIAGIVVPSFLRSVLPTKEVSAAVFLRTLNIVGVAFSYTTKNLEFAILGGLVGTMAALAIHFHALTLKDTVSTRTTTLEAAVVRQNSGQL